MAWYIFSFFACCILDSKVDDLAICSDLRNLGISGFGLHLASQTVVVKRSVSSNEELLQN